MKAVIYLLLLTSLGAFAAPLHAAQTQQATRSAGKLKLDQSIDLSQLLAQSEAQYKNAPTLSQDYASSADASRMAGIANRHDQLFEIFTADVHLGADFDGDGFHHEIIVNFDVDVSVDSATLYAKLYLSREGGPWSQYFTTNLFHISGDSAADSYEVITELVEGYYPGYYDVLIEVYSLDHAYMVTSEVLDFNYLGNSIRLEDRGWDEPYYDDFYSEFGVSYGAGSFSLLIFFLIIQVVIAARGSLTLTPYKTIKIKTRNP